jgi:hypothetical protein
MNYHCGKTLPEVFNYFHISLKDRDYIERVLTSEGYTTLGICYGATRSEEKLLRFADDSRLPNIFINEVRKNALKPGDPRWDIRKEN